MQEMKQNVPALDSEYVANTYARFPLTLTHGKGVLVYDEAGKEYIDLATGIAVNTFGYADDAWMQAVTAQLGALQHTSNLYYTEPCAKLAELLCSRTGMKKVFFSNSGAEANECAIKTARKYAADKYGPARHVILTLENSFHGRTITTLAATGQAVFHQDFQPQTPGFEAFPANDAAAICERMAKGDVAAVLFECVQGEGGVLPLEPAFVAAIAKTAAEQDVLLACDEVQCGNGRTGKLYGYMHYGITPDIVSTAKGLGGGLPIGATLMGEKVQSVLKSGDHGSTFGGNPVCCAGALNVLSRLDDVLLSQVTEKSQYLFDTLSHTPGVRSVTGLGLMIGVETEGDAGEILKRCMDASVLVIKAKQKLRLLPALNIPWDALKKATEILCKCIAE